MQSAWFARLFFATVAALAVSGVISGAACTRWGQPGPVPSTIAPLSTIYVNPTTGSDTTGNGSTNKPYKTLTKAVAVLASAKSFAQGGVTISLASGDYSTANGEKFPIVVPKNVTINGTNFGTGPKTGSFVDGHGEDTILEGLTHAPARTIYTTIEVVPPASVNFGSLYVGASKLSLPNARAGYAALDVVGSLNATDSAFAAGIVSKSQNVNGVLVAGGSLTCSSCQIQGNNFGIGALAVPLPTSSPSIGIPSITLMHSTGDSTVAAKVVDIITDGSANVTVSNEVFEQAAYAFKDTLRPVIAVSTRGAVDFGGGTGGSSGLNDFIGAGVTEIAVSRGAETIVALDDTWNPSQQGANRNGQYMRSITFGSGDSGKNVTIIHNALGSTVTVGPASVPTPTPTGSPSPTASPT
ncbi:MAG TPA: DUF1565 domain-containing protein [Candidatus Cybelea sp.]|jgi:hypothetical protein|nr:DUF1565 domain-containing protein [Candidatus Cybelea sp.]